MAVATTEADEAIASSVFFQIMGIPLKKLLAGVILVIFGHFASSDFKVWLRSCSYVTSGFVTLIYFHVHAHVTSL